MPSEKDKILKFTKWSATLPMPVTCFASFTSIARPIQSRERQRNFVHHDGKQIPVMGQDRLTESHHITGYSYVIVYSSPIDREPRVESYFGNDAPQRFLDSIQSEARQAVTLLKTNLPPEHTVESDRLLSTTSSCNICKKQLLPGQVTAVEHCHLTGRIR